MTRQGPGVRWHRWILAVLIPLVSAGGARADAFGDRQMPAAASSAEESPDRLKALGLSLLVPGLAHLEMGETRRGLIFLTAEAAFWTAFAVFRVQGGIRKDSYIEMAELDAGVPTAEGRSDDYYRLLGLWPSSESYNQLIRREARDLYGDDLEAREAYYETHRVPPDQVWAWESWAAWDRYRTKRSDSQSAYRQGRNMIALAVANRLVAMVDVTLLQSRRVAGETLRLHMTPGAGFASAELRLSCSLP